MRTSTDSKLISLRARPTWCWEAITSGYFGVASDRLRTVKYTVCDRKIAAKPTHPSPCALVVMELTPYMLQQQWRIGETSAFSCEFPTPVRNHREPLALRMACSCNPHKQRGNTTLGAIAISLFDYSGLHWAFYYPFKSLITIHFYLRETGNLLIYSIKQAELNRFNISASPLGIYPQHILCNAAWRTIIPFAPPGPYRGIIRCKAGVAQW